MSCMAARLARSHASQCLQGSCKFLYDCGHAYFLQFARFLSKHTRFSGKICKILLQAWYARFLQEPNVWSSSSYLPSRDLVQSESVVFWLTSPGTPATIHTKYIYRLHNMCAGFRVCRALVSYASPLLLYRVRNCNVASLGTRTLCLLKFLLCYALIPNTKPIMLIVVYLLCSRFL